MYSQTIDKPVLADVPSSWPKSDYTWTLETENLNTSNWTSAATGTFHAGAGGVTGDNFSVISNSRLTNAQYDASFTLSLKSDGGVYRLFTNATSDLGGPSTYYSLEISNVTFNGAVCTAKASVYESSGGNPPVLLDEAPAACGDGKTYHLVTLPTGDLVAYVDRKLLIWTKSHTALTGQPGVGGRTIPAENRITKLSTIRLQSPRLSLFEFKALKVKATATSLDLTWPNVNENSGVGTAYQMLTIHTPS